jgi:hypothetical protein
MTDKAFEMTRRAVEMEEEETAMRNLEIEKEKASQAMAEEEGRKRAAEEQGYFQELHDSHGPKGTRVVEQRLQEQPQQKEPQDDDGFFGDSDNEGKNMSKKPRAAKKPKVTKKATRLVKKGTRRIKKRNVVAEEDSDSDSTDPLGDMEDVISFWWGEQPKFEVKWSKCGMTMEAAEHVLMDMPQKALEILWKKHRNLQVLNWVNSLKGMKDAVSEWKDIESYAARQRWDGSLEIPKVAALNVNGLDDADVPNEDDGGKRQQYCRLTDHRWETCDKGAYVESNGVLFGRSCLLCDVKFQPGIKRSGDDVENKYWLTLKNKVEHCMKCDVCLCVICYPRFMEQQGLMDEKRSPRKAKVQIKYNR